MKLFKPKWHVQVTEDVMTSGKIWEVSSPIIKPLEYLGFPYEYTEAQIIVRFSRSAELAAIKSCDLTNADATQIDKYNRLVPVRIRWDNELEQVSLTQKFLSSYLVFPDASKIIDRLCTSKQMIIEFGWYYDRTIHFKFDLTGAADIIWKVKNEAASQKGEGAIDEIIYGLDFGYNNPTACLRIGLKDGNIYILDELFKKEGK